MLNKCALCLTDFLYKKADLIENKRKIYIYGFEIAMSTLLGIFSMTLVACLFFRVTDILAFLIFFMFTRFFSGGFHAKTYARCFVLSNSLFLGCCFAVSLLLFLDIWWLPLIIALLSAPIILGLAPIRNEKHPLSEQSYQRNKRIAHVLVAVQLAAILLMTLSAQLQAFQASASISMMANAVMMIIAIIERRITQ